MLRYFLTLSLIWSLGSYASVSYPKGLKPFADKKAKVGQWTKKQKAQLLSHVYAVMLAYEKEQGMPIVASNKISIPQWLENFLWETSDATGSPNLSYVATEQECKEKRNVISETPRCVFGGHIICTAKPKPRCPKKNLPRDHYCGSDGIKCGGGIGSCEGGSFVPKCQELGGVKEEDAAGKLITNACLGSRNRDDLATEVAECISESQLADLQTDMEGLCAEVRNRPGGQENLAGTADACEEMTNYFVAIKAKHAKKNLDREANETERKKLEEEARLEDERQRVCDGLGDGYEKICDGEDQLAKCEEVDYVINSHKVDGCIQVEYQIAGATSGGDKFCKNEAKAQTSGDANSQRSRQLDLLFRQLTENLNPERLARGQPKRRIDGATVLLTDERGVVQPENMAEFRKYLFEQSSHRSHKAAISEFIDSCKGSSKQIIRVADGPSAKLSMANARDDNGKLLARGTFVCAEVDSGGKMKKLLNYVTTYSTPMNENSGGISEGKLRYLEIGRYSHNNSYEKYPMNAKIWRHDEEKPFLTLRPPARLEIGRLGGFFNDEGEGLVYNAKENTCAGVKTSNRRHNKLYKKGDEIIACDSPDDKDYDYYASLADITSTTGDTKTEYRGDFHSAASLPKLQKIVVPNAGNGCEWCWEDASASASASACTPISRVSGTPRRSIRRTMQSVEKPKVVEP